MSGKFFIDTNIFVYSFDQTDPLKNKNSLEIIEMGIESGQGCISMQVVQEFINVATRKFKVPMKTTDLIVYLDKVMMPLCKTQINYDIITKALSLKDKFKFSFFDSSILSAAIYLSSEVLYSEDFKHNQKIDNVKIVNPFI